MKAAALFLVFAGFVSAQTQTPEPPMHPAVPATREGESVTALTSIKRVYVDVLAGDATAESIRQLIIASLQQSRLFILTDNPDRADATLKGAANDTPFTDTFDSSEGLSAHANSGIYEGRTANARTNGGYNGLSVGENESHHIRERKHEAFATVRLCNRDGDVLWATTQESKGAKFRGASVDVADKIMRQLQTDFTRTAPGTFRPAAVVNPMNIPARTTP
jgi:hypothetical protein